MTRPRLLEMRNISKTFPGVKALDDVSFDLVSGEVHAVVGENGAGKSTLMKILAGVYQPDEGGEIALQGQPKKIGSPREAQRWGISIVHQEFNLIPCLTVAENIFLGREKRSKLGFINDKQLAQDAVGLLRRLGVDLNVRERIENLTVPQMQLVEIARCLAVNAKVIVMDEPTAALGPREIDHLGQIIGALKDQGVGVVFISHRLDEVLRFSDRITILKDGRMMGTFKANAISKDEIIRLMVGRNIADSKQHRDVSVRAEPVLSVRRLSRKGVVNNVSFDLHKGEILGITGLLGSGRTEMVRLITGLEPMDGGEVYIKGRRVNIRNAWEAVQNGIGYVTENRRDEGLILERPVRENISLVILHRLTRFGFINRKTEAAKALPYIARLEIKLSSIEQRVKYLSGGNQQKLVLAKWLLADPDILIIDEPTRGIDVGAKSEIYAIIRNLADEGKSILLISSELPEVLALADRILVMSRGSVVGEFAGGEASEERIMSCELAEGSC